MDIQTHILGRTPIPHALPRPKEDGVPLRNRRHVIPLRLTAKELHHLNTQVERSGLSREEYLRALVMGTELHPRPCTHRADLLRKVAGLCNNANQLAHRANSTGVAGQESVDKMIRISQEIWKEVKNQW